MRGLSQPLGVRALWALRARGRLRLHFGEVMGLAWYRRAGAIRPDGIDVVSRVLSPPSEKTDRQENVCAVLDLYRESR